MTTTAFEVLNSLQSAPLGADMNEAHLQRPYNSATDLIRVRVRNHSAVKERAVYHKDRLSWVRNGLQQLKEARASKDPALREFDLEQARREVYMGTRDPNMSMLMIKPVDAVLQLDNKKYVIPAQSVTGENAPWTDVPEGLYDLYCGNANRLSGTPKERAEELALMDFRRGKADKDIVMRPGALHSDWAYLEFERTVVKPSAVAMENFDLTDQYIEV